MAITRKRPQREGFAERVKKVAVTPGKELPSDRGFGVIFVVDGCGWGAKRCQHEGNEPS